MFTELEKQFMEALANECYGGLTFFDDVVESGKLDSKTMRGVVSSLVKKDILRLAEEDGLIGLVTDPEDIIDGIDWEFNKEEVIKILEG